MKLLLFGFICGVLLSAGFGVLAQHDKKDCAPIDGAPLKPSGAIGTEGDCGMLVLGEWRWFPQGADGYCHTEDAPLKP